MWTFPKKPESKERTQKNWRKNPTSRLYNHPFGFDVHMCVKCNRQHLDYLPKTKDIANMYVTQIPRIAWKFTTNTRDACKIASHIIFSTECDAWNEYVYLYIPTRAHIAPFAIVGFGLTVVIFTLEIRIWMLCLIRWNYPILSFSMSLLHVFVSRIS